MLCVHVSTKAEHLLITIRLLMIHEYKLLESEGITKNQSLSILQDNSVMKWEKRWYIFNHVLDVVNLCWSGLPMQANAVFVITQTLANVQS